MEDKNLIYNVKKYASKNAWQRVTLARLKERPTALDYINIIFDDFIELHGDRSFSDDQSIVCGIGLLNNKSVTVIAQQKGKNLKDNIKRNFGMPKPEGYRKALRIMKQAEKFKKTSCMFYRYTRSFLWYRCRRKRSRGSYSKKSIRNVQIKDYNLIYSHRRRWKWWSFSFRGIR